MTKTDEAIKTNDVKESAADAKKAHEKAIRDANNKSMALAKKAVVKFMDTPEYTKLPDDVKKAIKRICGKTRVAGVQKDSFADQLSGWFKKTKDAMSELDIFKATKMGRGEFRKRVRESLKKAAPEARQWIEFNEDTEEWVLLGTGKAMPKGFRGKAID